jgi:hypothetical protein
MEPPITEGWLGPGRKDGEIRLIPQGDDALHIQVGKKNNFEWWYFDARLDSGHTVVIFFYAANPNPGPAAGKTGVEMVLVRPDGRKTQVFLPYKRSAFTASTEKADVKIGQNYLIAEYPDGGLPVYRIHIDENELGFDLTYSALVNGWKPGNGRTEFGKLGYFAWVIPFVRASVEGTVRDGDRSTPSVPVAGVGYHDHNWLNFMFQTCIDYWMWGRVYSETYSLSYAFIQCNKRAGNHQIKVLMLAKGQDVILSSGEFEFLPSAFEYNASAKHSFPRQVVIRVPDVLELRMAVENVLEAEDMLDRFPKVLQFLARNLLRLKPGYFRLQSGFELDVQENGETLQERGSTLHEIVLFKDASPS